MVHEDFVDFETIIVDFESRHLLSDSQITHIKHRLTEILHHQPYQEPISCIHVDTLWPVRCLKARLKVL